MTMYSILTEDSQPVVAQAQPAPATNSNSHTEKAIKLRQLLPFFLEKDKGFINSLIDWNQGKGRDFSPKQLFYVDRFIAEGEEKRNKNKAAMAINNHPRNFKNIAKLFLYSKQVASLAYPKITYQLAKELPPITLYYNNNHGCIQAKVAGRLVATIKANGQEDMRWPIKDNYLAMLETIEKDPIAAATLSGKLTSCCSFCSRELTDERSVVLGYGPVCAEHWNLPWDVKRTGSTTVTEEL